MSDFLFKKCSLQNIIQIIPQMNIGKNDAFIKNYEQNKYAEHGIDFIPTEEYLITEDKDIFRGIHFQNYKPQKRIISVLAGEAYITVVDLNRESSQLGAYEIFLLNAEEPKLIFIPEWYGAATISRKHNTTISVMNDGPYYKEYSSGVRYDDPTLQIQWPVNHFRVSEKDKNLMTFQEYLRS